MSSQYLCWFLLVIWDCWSTVDLDALQCSECFPPKGRFQRQTLHCLRMNVFVFFLPPLFYLQRPISMLTSRKWFLLCHICAFARHFSAWIAIHMSLRIPKSWPSLKPKSEDLHEPLSGLLQVAPLSLETACIITMTHVLYFFLHSLFFFNLDTCIFFMSKPFPFPRSYPRVASTESPTLEFPQSALTDPPHYSHHTLAHI